MVPVLPCLSRAPILLFVVALGGCAEEPPRVAHVEFGQSIWAEGQRGAGVLFQDGGQSIPVEGGSLWLFGDTFIGKPQAGQPPSRSQITGARAPIIAMLPAGKTNLPPDLNYFAGEDGIVAMQLDWLPGENAKDNRIWPLYGITIGSRVYTYYTLIEMTKGPPPWNFRGVGAGLAMGDRPLEHYKRLQHDGKWRYPVEPTQVIREGDWLYLFEISSTPKGLILARVAAKEIEDPAAYEFLTVTGWSKKRDDVKVILREAYGQVSVQWMPSWKCYVMATSSDFFHPSEIQLRQARSLEGPWSPPTRIAVPEMPGKKTTLVYCTFLHPELGGGPASFQLVATFCRTLAGDWELSNPEWVSITLAP